MYPFKIILTVLIAAYFLKEFVKKSINFEVEKLLTIFGVLYLVMPTNQSMFNLYYPVLNCEAILREF